MYVYKLRISYDGTAYSGWQIQKGTLSIQGEIEKRLTTILRKKTRIIGAGRTDAGVHALGQVAHFSSEDIVDPKRLLYSLNCLLKNDIRILEMEATDEDFHAQYSAKGKIYHYHIWTEDVVDPFLRLYRTHIRYPLSINLLQQALPLFVGELDFCTFANKGSSAKTTRRHLRELRFIPQEGGFRLEFVGEGFLYKMVRNITGVLLEIASGKRSLEEIPSLFALRDRRSIKMAAPSQGLFLMEVLY